MLSKLYSGLSIIAIATLLALGGFVAYLFSAGKLNSARLDSIAAVLRGQIDAAAPSTPADAGHAPPTSQRAPDSAVAAAGRSIDEIRQQRVREQITRATLERATADLTARQNLLNQSLQHLISLQEEFEKGKSTWMTQKKKLSETVKDEGFLRELQYVGKLTPKLAKEHVIRTWQKQKADAVRLFVAIDPGKGQKILEQFKTQEELGIMHELLEQLRAADVDKLVNGSGKTANAKEQ